MVNCLKSETFSTAECVLVYTAGVNIISRPEGRFEIEMASAHRPSGGLWRAFEISGERGIWETSTKTSSNGAPRILADAWGRSRTTHNSFIPKHPLTSPTRASSCQGGCRGFDPRFPPQANRTRRVSSLSVRGPGPPQGPRKRSRKSGIAADLLGSFSLSPDSPARDGSQHHEGFCTRGDGVGQRGIRRFVGHIFRTGEETDERSSSLRDVVPNRAAQDGVARLELVQDRALRRRAVDVEAHLTGDPRERAQMRRQDDSDHGRGRV